MLRTDSLSFICFANCSSVYNRGRGELWEQSFNCLLIYFSSHRRDAGISLPFCNKGKGRSPSSKRICYGNFSPGIRSVCFQSCDSFPDVRSTRAHELLKITQNDDVELTCHSQIVQKIDGFVHVFRIDPNLLISLQPSGSCLPLGALLLGSRLPPPLPSLVHEVLTDAVNPPTVPHASLLAGVGCLPTVMALGCPALP